MTRLQDRWVDNGPEPVPCGPERAWEDTRPRSLNLDPLPSTQVAQLPSPRKLGHRARKRHRDTKWQHQRTGGFQRCKGDAAAMRSRVGTSPWRGRFREASWGPAGPCVPDPAGERSSVVTFSGRA